MFGKLDPGAITLNRQQFLQMTRGLDAFRRLQDVIGSSAADAFTAMLYASEVAETNPNGRYVVIVGGDAAGHSARLEHIINTECDQALSKRDHAAMLLDAAKDGLLSQMLAEKVELGGDHKPGANRLPIEPEIKKACRWIVKSMYDDGSETIQELLTEAVIGQPKARALGPTPALLDKIHARLAPNAPTFRGPNPKTTYPSSISGRRLLEIIFEWTADAIWPVLGDDAWLDVALFYLGAVGTVQGYADGNKRVARMAYAITLLRGRYPFFAPERSFEDELIQMLGPEDQ